MQRQKDKQIKHKIKERVDILEKVDKDDIRIDIAKWITSLPSEEAELLNTLMIEHTKMHVRNYSIATLEIFENFTIPSIILLFISIKVTLSSPFSSLACS